MARKVARKHKQHYVDNKKFLEAMREWKEKCKEAEETGEERPQISNYVGECFLKIANGLSYRPNFINYTYKEDMISDEIDSKESLYNLINEIKEYKLVENVNDEDMIDVAILFFY